MGKKANSAPSFIESDGSFITKPTDIANYFNDYLIEEIIKLRHDMTATNAGKLLRIMADNIATPICHIFNLSLLESMCPQAWREAKVITLPKNRKAPFTGSNSRPISL